MPAFTQLVLDTTAPSVSWGAVGGTTAGELLQLAYSADEPIAFADLTLADGRVLVFTIGAAVLSVNLPADTPAGPADVRVVDDVGNERVYVALIVLQGAIVPVPTPTPLPRTLAPPLRIRRPRLIRHISRVQVRSSCTVRARTRNASRTRVDRRSSIAGRARRAGGARAATTSGLQSVVSSNRQQLRAELELAVRRRDGPDQELLLLWLVD